MVMSLEDPPFPLQWGTWAPPTNPNPHGCATHPRLWTSVMSILFISVMLTFLPVVRAVNISQPIKDTPHTDIAYSCQLPTIDTDLKEKYLYIKDKEHPITLLTSRRIPQQLLTKVVEVFLRKYMRYVNVVVSYADVFFPDDALRASGYDHKSENEYFVPTSLVNLEIWVSPEYSIEENLPFGMESILGASGRFGWFFLKELVTKKDLFDHWRIFQHSHSPGVGAFYRSTEELDLLLDLRRDASTDKFYCDSALEPRCHEGIYTPNNCLKDDCATLFTSYISESKSLLDQIEDMELYVKVAWLGPNLDEGFIRSNMNLKGGRSVLLYHWSPDVLLRIANFTSISFPSCTDHFKHFNKSYFCNYETHKFHKFIWSGLKAADGYLHKSLEKISMSSSDYKGLIDEYVSLKEKSIDVAVCNWMQNHKDKWMQWQNWVDRPVLKFFGLFPMASNNLEKQKFFAPGNVPSFSMAIADINANSSILSNYIVSAVVVNSQCDADIVMLEFIKFIKHSIDEGSYSKIIGIVGPACSDTIEPLAGVSKYFNVPIISYGAEGAIFSDRDQYPYFFRTIPENRIFRRVYLQLFQKMDWRRVASLTEDGYQYAEYLTPLHNLLQDNNITFNVRKYIQEGKSPSMVQYLDGLHNQEFKIIIGDFYQDDARTVLCDAYRLGMTGHEGYVWFLPRWYSEDWYNMEKWGASSNDMHCTTKELEKALQGHMSLSYRYFADNDSVTPANSTVKQWRQKYREMVSLWNYTESDYAGYTYDAVWTYALALDKLFKDDDSYTSNLRSPNTTEKFIHYINNTSFNGVSGHINFTNGASRVSDIIIWQFTNNSYREVGWFYPHPVDENRGRLDLKMSRLIWPMGEVPKDGRKECMVEGFRTFLGETAQCNTAIIVICTASFGSLSLLLVFMVLFLKHRYDASLKLMEELWRNQSIYKKFEGWEVARNKVVTSWKLGEGQFGKVYGGECLFDSQGWVQVAVKTLKMGATISEKLDFLYEAEVMKELDHLNIVKLLGVCTENEPIITIMEFMLYGDLHTYLLARRNLVGEKNRRDDDEVSNARLTSMALDVAKALAYLEQLNYVHRDVASRNCLVNAERTVKLADFGMTRPLNENSYYRFSRLGLLPVRWMATESLAKGIYTTMSDMWSYGVLLYEIITFGGVPFQDLKNNQVYEKVKVGHTLPIPPEIHSQLAILLQACWHQVPQKRPTANQVIVLLQNHPYLISPSLDEPQSSVTVDDQVGLEVQISSERNNRKLSFPSGPNASSSSSSSNRKRSTSGNMVLTAPSLTSSASEDCITTGLSSNLEAPNLNHVMMEVDETGGEDPLLPPAEPILLPANKFISSKLHSLSNKENEKEKENLVRRLPTDDSYIARDMWMSVTPV